MLTDPSEVDAEDISMYSESSVNSSCKSKGDVGSVEDAEEQKVPEDKKKMLSKKLLETKE